jgi:predicted homoserine dehydrogenase-like protein
VTDQAQFHVGVIGTGFVARHFTHEVERRPNYCLARVLTRRPLDRLAEFPRPEALTGSLDALIEASDVVFECTGDVLYAARTVGRVLAARKPVVTLNAELHVTVGSQLVERGVLSEAEGDQPGCLAALHEEALAMGFTPLVYGNIKGFLNRNPTPEDMAFWSRRNGISLPMVTAFTDGTKLQVEQCLVANGLGADIAKEELLGPAIDDLTKGAHRLAKAAARHGRPISDYLLSSQLPHGVFIVATHDERQRDALRYLKMGAGPYYVLVKRNIFVHLEVFKTIERIMSGAPPLLNNSRTPRVSVASVAKRRLMPGETIARGCGGFDLRGICVNMADRPGHVPICLAVDLRVRRRVEPGQILTMDDVEFPETEALSAWQAVERRALKSQQARAS